MFDRFILVLLITALSVTSRVNAQNGGAAASCNTQLNCVNFTTVRINPTNGLCSSSPCEYRICMTISQGPYCKKQTGTFSHTCRKSDNVCISPTGFSTATVISGIADGYTQCQVVAVNSTAEFLLKDASTCSGSAGTTLPTGNMVTCAPRPNTTSSCTGNDVGKECIWTVKAPKECCMACYETKAPVATPLLSAPVTPAPVVKPSKSPTRKPTKSPTRKPSKSPTRKPTKSPTRKPSKSPTRKPTKSPTRKPSKSPTRKPTKSPTRKPSKSPTRKPTKSPTRKPTKSPTRKPTKSPTRKPTTNPTKKPTTSPTKKPTTSPTKKPTTSPTQTPVATQTQKPAPGTTQSPTSPFKTEVSTSISENPGSCSKQQGCLWFTATKINSTKCTEAQCEYQICMTVIKFGQCAEVGRFTDTCIKDNSTCVETSGFLGATPEMGGLENGLTQCQTVGVNQEAQFILKDGDTCDGSSTMDIGSGYVASCQGRTEDTPTCTGYAPGTECVWTVKAPSSCGNTGGSGGDPHFKLWNATRYPFHGECDLILLDNKDFNNGTGLHIHIRTSMQFSWSYIEAVAIRIGKDVVEITRDGQFWLNGVDGSEIKLPSAVAEFTFSALQNVHGRNTKTFRVDLNNGDYITIRAYQKFISLDVFGLDKDFENGVGMMGHYHTGAMLAKDGVTIINDFDKFGLEWQVTADEPMLFRETRAPIYPVQCKLPVAATRRRKLRAQDDPALVSAAEEACKHKNSNDFEFCMFDVLATGDINMAFSW